MFDEQKFRNMLEGNLDKIKFGKIVPQKIPDMPPKMPDVETTVQKLKVNGDDKLFVGENKLPIFAYKKDNRGRVFNKTYAGLISINTLKPKDYTRIHLKRCIHITSDKIPKDTIRQTQKTSDFTVDVKDNETREINLLVCQDCLIEIEKELKIIGYPISYRQSYYHGVKCQDPDNFNLALFSKLYWEHYGAINTDFEDIASEYTYTGYAPLELHERKRQYTFERQGYICQNCRVNLKKHQKGLITLDHINNIKTDYNDENLNTLCAECHAIKDVHQINEKKQKQLQKLRKDQGLKNPNAPQN